MQVNGNVSIVSGGASGLGEATCRLLAQKKARVAILDIAEDQGQRLASELGDTVVFCKTDVTDTDSVQGAIDQTM